MENLTELLANCSQFYTEQRFVNVAVTSATAACLSLLVCLFGVFIIILFKKWQSFGQRLIAYLIISVTLFSIAATIRRVDFDEDFSAADVRFCSFSGFFVQITLWNMLDSIVAITLYLFLAVVCDKFTEKYELLYVLFIFVFPLVFGWIPFIHNTFGRAGIWCWIKLVNLETCERLIFGQVLQLAMFYVPHLALFPSIILVYLIMLCKLSRNRARWRGTRDESYKQTNRLLKSETEHLLAYPLIFFLLSLPTVAVRVHNWIAPEQSILPLWYIAVITSNLIGAALTLTSLLLDKDTRSKLRWRHMQAALKNCHVRRRISEYAIESVVEGETKVSQVGEDIHRSLASS